MRNFFYYEIDFYYKIDQCYAQLTQRALSLAQG